MILWYNLSDETQAALLAYQRRHFRCKLELTRLETRLITAPLESTEEIGKLMTHAPEHPERIK